MLQPAVRIDISDDTRGRPIVEGYSRVEADSL